MFKGNSSLALKDVQPQHGGEYMCHVNNESGAVKKTVQLIVAAPYDEPLLAVHYTYNNVTVTLSASHGFPEPTVCWRSPAGRNVTTTELDPTGCYRVQSNLTFNLNTTQTVVVEMCLNILTQCYVKEIMLHPQQGMKV
ncbi:hypothetical protein NFI96_018841 [Prochilodus magdalenae]|nr:hypothetical protein NFI96_018841 [Prochilodus magdalenae]